MPDVMTLIKDWTTKAGLRAVLVVYRHPTSTIKLKWLCGYVGFPPGHPLYGCRTPPPPEKEIDPDDLPLADVFGDDLETVIDVHGGVTLLGYHTPLDRLVGNEEEWWWIGFDTAHADDLDGKTPPGYCVGECERMAAQLHELSKR